MRKKRLWERRDPEAKAEAARYAHPVPSRTYIRQYLEDQGVRRLEVEDVDPPTAGTAPRVGVPEGLLAHVVADNARPR